jgi:hypothetical protein
VIRHILTQFGFSINTTLMLSHYMIALKPFAKLIYR